MSIISNFIFKSRFDPFTNSFLLIFFINSCVIIYLFNDQHNTLYNVYGISASDT